MATAEATATRTERAVRPLYEVRELQDEYEVKVYMPGVNKQGIEIALDDDELTINGTRTQSIPQGWRLLSRESRSENYKLRLRLNVEVNGEKIAASTEDGVLRLVLPKAEAAKPRRIAVE